MLLCQIISLHGQIVVLVDKGNIQPGGTGVTVLAVDAASGGNDLCLRLCADDGGAYADDADLFPAVGQNAVFSIYGLLFLQLVGLIHASLQRKDPVAEFAHGQVA